MEVDLKVENIKGLVKHQYQQLLILIATNSETQFLFLCHINIIYSLIIVFLNRPYSKLEAETCYYNQPAVLKIP